MYLITETYSDGGHTSITYEKFDFSVYPEDGLPHHSSKSFSHIYKYLVRTEHEAKLANQNSGGT